MIFTRLILERIRSAVDSKLRDEKDRFRDGKSCVDQIATHYNRRTVLRVAVASKNSMRTS